MAYPTETRAIVLERSKDGPLYYDAVLKTLPVPPLKDGEVLVRIGAAGFNHRELWQRKNQYPSTTEHAVMGAGIVIASSVPEDPILRRKVMLVPMRGWESNPRGPESRFTVFGGIPLGGTFSEFVVVERTQLVPVPEYLPLVMAAAWPVAGVTAWRAVKINADVKEGDNVLITGIGGGVALVALQLCVALGAKVFVTSSSPAKLEKAISLGAVGGVNYKNADWPASLAELLTKAGGSSKIQAIIDSAGGDIIGQTGRLLDYGARVVCYGITTQAEIKFRMSEVLKGVQLKGSTMGSRYDLIDATNFITKHNIVPEVSTVLRGLEEAEEGFKLLQAGDQMGKIIIKFPGRTPDGDIRL